MERRTRSALLVIDFQTDFLSPQGRWPVSLAQAPSILRTVNRLIRLTARAGIEVVYVANEFSAELGQPATFLNGAARRGQPGVELDPRLIVVNSNYFAKHQCNAFGNRRLEPFLCNVGCTDLILTGVFASECIKSTALGALKRGFRVWVVSNAVADKDAPTKLNALQALARKGVVVVTAQELLATTGTKPFKWRSCFSLADSSCAA